MEQYELYCLADGRFYDTLEHSTAEDADFPIMRRPIPEMPAALTQIIEAQKQ